MRLISFFIQSTQDIMDLMSNQAKIVFVISIIALVAKTVFIFLYYFVIKDLILITLFQNPPYNPSYVNSFIRPLSKYCCELYPESLSADL